MKVLVTGDRGYIGSVMAPYLIEHGHDVVGFDTNYYADCDFGTVYSNYRQIDGDIRDVTVQDLHGFEAVVHLAALSNDPLGDLRSNWTFDINRDATTRLGQLAKEAGVKRFVYASSCSIYGASGDAPVDETAPLVPMTAYAASKVNAESGLSALASDDFSPVFMRNATAYGSSPRLRIDIVINNLTAWAVSTGAIRVLSDGTPWRPVVHVEDICQAVAVVLEQPRHLGHNQAFNVGSDSENYQVKHLAQMVSDVTGCSVAMSVTNNPDVRNYRVKFEKFHTTFPSFRSKWTAAAGVEQLYRDYRHYGFSQQHLDGREFVRVRQLNHLLTGECLDGGLRWQKARVA